MDSYNFLVSQRLTVILAGNLLQARATSTIETDFLISSFTVTKNHVKIENLLITRPPFVEQLPLQTILLYGATTLRIMWDEARERRKTLKSRQRAILVNLEARTQSPASIFSKISTFRHHGCMRQGCLSVRSSSCGPRRALILGEDQARPSRSCLILKDFHLKRLRESQKPETSKTYHRRKPLSSSNSPCPGITLRCNHSTNHM